jgi:hypothetical protein
MEDVFKIFWVGLFTMIVAIVVVSCTYWYNYHLNRSSKNDPELACIEARGVWTKQNDYYVYYYCSWPKTP